MELHAKKFEELTNQELYEILKTRIDVFVVEQKCPYPEADGLDPYAVHVWFSDEEGIAAYLRAFPEGIISGYAALGRVLTVRRGKGLGSAILEEGIRVAEEMFGADTIRIEAQVYAQGFYEKHGFVQASEPFEEDGIPHIVMIRKKAGL